MQTVLLFTALSRYFPTAANEPEVSHIHRKRLTSALKSKLDKIHFFWGGGVKKYTWKIAESDPLQ